MKVAVEIEIEVDDDANFLSSTPNHHLKDIEEELKLALYEIDDIEILKTTLEEV